MIKLRFMCMMLKGMHYLIARASIGDNTKYTQTLIEQINSLEKDIYKTYNALAKE